MSLFAQAYTLYSSVRPFGASVIFASFNDDGPALYMMEPSGLFFGFKGVAIGKGKQIAKTEIEKLKFNEMDALQAVKEAARIIHIVHDDAKDKDFELEISWVLSNKIHEMVPEEIINEAEAYARRVLRPDEMED